GDSKSYVWVDPQVKAMNDDGTEGARSGAKYIAFMTTNNGLGRKLNLSLYSFRCRASRSPHSKGVALTVESGAPPV
ncbi:hypothetical protein BHM03_00028705, partial [Ensete ventricosum]